MRIGHLIFFCYILFFLSCGNGNGSSKGLLSEEKMEAVLWDIMRADQFLNDYVLNKDTSIDKRMESIKLYRQVFALHKVSKEDFQKSFNYYLREPARFKTILDSVAVRRNALVGPVRQDSIGQDTVRRLE